MTLRRLRSFLLSAALLAPFAAHAHPGHTVIDFTAGAPHAGHAGEWGALVAGMIAAALVATGWHLVKRRR